MRSGINILIASSVALVLLPGLAAYAAPPDQKDLKDVLHQLDLAASGFRSTAADVEYDNVQTDPIYNKDIDRGIVYYKRDGRSFQMAVHFREEAVGVEKNKPVQYKPEPKDLIYSAGKVTLYQADKVYVKDAAKFESYLLLGFGASGSELAAKWDIAYLGPETLTDGKTSVKTEKLELVAKDQDVRKMIPKVTIWIDAARAVSLKQIFDLGQGQSKTCYYSNIKLNPTLADSDFIIKTGSKTQIMR